MGFRPTIDGFYGLDRSTNYTGHHLQGSEAVRQFIDEGLSRGLPYFYDRHLHFIDFRDFGYPNPTYISLVREPLARRVSSFYFLRECVCNHFNLQEGRVQPPNEIAWCKNYVDVVRGKGNVFCSADINMLATIRESVDPMVQLLLLKLFKTDDPYATKVDASPETPMPYVNFFCGHDERICGANADIRGAIDHAKTVIRDVYSWVGVLEHFEASLILLQKMWPGWMENVNIKHLLYNKQKHKNKGFKAPPLSPATRDMVGRALWPG